MFCSIRCVLGCSIYTRMRLIGFEVLIKTLPLKAPKATAVATLTMITNSQGILSTWMMGPSSKPPNYDSAKIVLLVFLF
ncbi:hypothetical protein B0H34DRAFT_698908 [Crassisporium funariophilum]|nr:hypothetical protein B0H34DRAFT_698908 [Crassisporium funariophilum]